MAVEAVNQNNLNTLIDENDIVVIDFWAEWCAPCKQFAKTFEKTSKQYPSIQFAKINIEKETELADVFQIRSIPHLIIFKEGVAIYSDSGSMPESTLKELLQQAMDTDISEIKKQLAQEE